MKFNRLQGNCYAFKKVLSNFQILRFFIKHLLHRFRHRNFSATT